MAHMRNTPPGEGGALEGVISKVDSRDNTDAAPNLQAAAVLCEGLRLMAAVELIAQGLRLLPDGHREDTLLSLLESFDYGPLGIPWNDIEDEARDWASWASRRELRAYAAAAGGRLPAADRCLLGAALIEGAR